MNAKMETRETEFKKSQLSYDAAVEEFKAYNSRYVEGMSKVGWNNFPSHFWRFSKSSCN